MHRGGAVGVVGEVVEVGGRYGGVREGVGHGAGAPHGGYGVERRHGAVGRHDAELRWPWRARPCMVFRVLCFVFH